MRYMALEVLGFLVVCYGFGYGLASILAMVAA